MDIAGDVVAVLVLIVLVLCLFYATKEVLEWAGLREPLAGSLAAIGAILTMAGIIIAAIVMGLT
jgi:hypothetical protein